MICNRSPCIKIRPLHVRNEDPIVMETLGKVRGPHSLRDPDIIQNGEIDLLGGQGSGAERYRAAAGDIDIIFDRDAAERFIVEDHVDVRPVFFRIRWLYGNTSHVDGPRGEGNGAIPALERLQPLIQERGD